MLRRAKLQLHAHRERSARFWSRAEAVQSDDEARLRAQRQLWAQHRAQRELEGQQLLSALALELRRWHSDARAAHERTCAALRCRRDEVDGDLQWRVYCARLSHEAREQVRVLPLRGDQAKLCDSALQLQLRGAERPLL